MNNIFQRIIKNHYEWQRPSPGRRGKYGEGEFVQMNGFGHEDWNFNDELIIDDNIYGYTYYVPTESKKKEMHNIIFGVYDNSKWYIVGIYKEAEYIDKSPLSKYVLDRKVNDLLEISECLSKKYQERKNVVKEIKDSTQWLHWKVKPSNIIRTATRIEIPRKTFFTENYRIVKPTNLTDKEYDSLLLLLEKQFDNIIIPDLSVEFPEGRIIEILHKSRERNPTIIKMAKENYKQKNKNLECEICGFSFVKVYGNIGIDFIEAHHTLALSDMKSKSKTKVEDIALVCANCHRMLHKKRPWLSMQEIKLLLKSQNTAPNKS